MATNFIREGKLISLAVPSTVDSEEPVVVGDLHGVAVTDYNSTSGEAVIDLGPSVYDLSVTPVSAMDIGDPIYINPITWALTDDNTKKYFGNTLESIAAGTATTVNVRVQQSPSFEGGVGEVITSCKFNTWPICGNKTNGGVPSGTEGDENLMIIGKDTFEYHILGTQTILAPPLTATGLNVGGMDQTANDGIEVTQGILANNPGVFTVGTSPAFYARCKFSIADVSGTDDCAFGFRKLEAYQANIDGYDEWAALNVISGAIYTETELNAGGTTSTDTTDTWADGESHTLEVKVSAAGVVSFLIDGAAPTAVAATAYTFDDGEVVIPFFYYLFDTTSPGAITLQTWEVGYQ